MYFLNYRTLLQGNLERWILVFTKILYMRIIAWLFGDVRLERHEAAVLLKELIDLNIVQPSSVSLNQNKHRKFNLTLYGSCNTSALKQFAAEKGLRVEENTQKGSCTISKL
jgi:hypothetical protein